jgi:hypothetical protein
MGALIKTGYDQQICDALNTRFSDLPDPSQPRQDHARIHQIPGPQRSRLAVQ